MMKRYCLYTILTVLVAHLFLFLNYANATTSSLKYAYIEFPPFTYTDTNKQPSGFLVDWASKIFPKAGYKFTSESLPVLRLAGYIVDGKVDIWMGLKTLPQFKNTTYKGTVKITDLILRAYTTKKNKKIIKKEDLKGTSVIILRGYSYGGWINYIKNPKNSVDYLKANKHTSALKMLRAGRGDYLLDYKAPCNIAQKKVTIKNLKHNDISSLPIYFIVSGKLKNGGDVLKNLEREFKKLKNSGKLKY
ncbi:MAG: amino acid ABC transporter substrate-binding protein [Deltaproteobacteria bacterium]|nr:amino acid ABC transporter substrate-binding protein [Deltaproteobacteria bacterium]